MSAETISAVGLYFLSVTMIVGLFGNVVTFAVFHKGALCKRSKCAGYFKALSVADIYVLVFPCVEYLLYCLPEPVLFRLLNNFTCKFATFNIYFAVEVSTWITVAVTFDRMLTVCLPLKCKKFTDEKWTYAKIAAIVLFFFVVNIYELVLNELSTVQAVDSDDVYILCNTVTSRDTMAVLEMTSINLFIFALPITINVVCNFLILRTMYKRASNFQGRGMSQRQRASRTAQAKSVTYRVLAICIVHFLTTAPFSAIHIYTLTVESISETTWDVIRVLNLFYYTNSGINFFMYVATGRDFRQDLANALPCCRPRARVSEVDRSSSPIKTITKSI